MFSFSLLKEREENGFGGAFFVSWGRQGSIAIQIEGEKKLGFLARGTNGLGQNLGRLHLRDSNIPFRYLLRDKALRCFVGFIGAFERFAGILPGSTNTPIAYELHGTLDLYPPELMGTVAGAVENTLLLSGYLLGYRFVTHDIEGSTDRTHKPSFVAFVIRLRQEGRQTMRKLIPARL
jgi:hypothetical protein